MQRLFVVGLSCMLSLVDLACGQEASPYDYVRPDAATIVSCPAGTPDGQPKLEQTFFGRDGWQVLLPPRILKRVEIDRGLLRCEYAWFHGSDDSHMLAKRLPSGRCELYRKGARFPIERSPPPVSISQPSAPPSQNQDYRVCEVRRELRNAQLMATTQEELKAAQDRVASECFVACPR